MSFPEFLKGRDAAGVMLTSHQLEVADGNEIRADDSGRPFIAPDVQAAIDWIMPIDASHKATYSGSDIDFVETFRTASQVESNRLAKATLGYTAGDVTSVTTLIYDTDGTTVLKTVTQAITYSSSDYATDTQAVS